MSRATEKLDALAEELARKGDDALRLDIVQRARRFKRSWVEMAEALVHIRETRAFKRWGYEDLYEYCEHELQIRGATVDKLTGSFMALKRYAPQVLQRDGVAQTIPTYDAVDYFARAVRGPEEEGAGPKERRPTEPPAPAVVDELRQAVFDEQTPVTALKRRFNPILYPKPEGSETLDLLKKADGAARRLTAVLPNLEGLDADRRQRLVAELEALRDELEPLLEEARTRVETNEPAAATG